MTKKILITGGAGFIGSHVVRLFVQKYKDYKIINLDALTYAGNLSNLSDVEDAPNYSFKKVNIQDKEAVERVFQEEEITDVIHLAAESHVDRSITAPLEFVRTNVEGTVNLLNAAKSMWKEDMERHIFYHISTDEVYGALGKEGFFREDTPYHPNSPYSASKASSDHFVRAYSETFGLKTIITNCSNNYGPNQFPEKLIPLFINNIVHKKPLPVYGDGGFTRDWLYVKDHALAIDLIFHKGEPGNGYNIGGFNEWKNIDLIQLLIKEVDEKLGRAPGEDTSLITYVKDRPGHDRRYAIDASKLNRELGWKPTVNFEQGLSATVSWYLENGAWLEEVTSGAYQRYYEKMYAGR